MPFIQASIEEESDWKLIEWKKKKANSAKSTDRGVEVPGAHLQAALGSIDEEHPNVGNAKKLKPNSAEGQSNFLGPVGTIWDSVN